MPYIDKKSRGEVLGITDNRSVYQGRKAMTAGELNFILTHNIMTYFKNNGSRYQQVNDILGALEGAKLEFYRRIAAPYEDKKILENGDVY